MNKTPIRILLVEDNPADARLLQLVLEEKAAFPSRWTHVQRLSEAIEHLTQHQPEVVLLDLSLPDGHGIDTLVALQAYASHLPIVVITGTDDETLALNAMHAGAQDYLVKGQIDGELLARTLRYSIERRQAEDARRESEERFGLAIQGAPYPIQIHAEDGQVISVNQAWVEQTGYDPAEMSTIEAWTKRAYRERAEQAQQEIKALYTATGQVDEGEDTIYTAAGETRDWSFSSSPLGRLPDGRRLVISMAVDITERKRAEEDLAARERRFRALIENAPDGIALLGMDGKLQQVTPTVQQILGYTMEESVGQDPAILTHPEDLPDLLVLLNDLIQHPGKVTRTVYRFRNKDGSWRWLESIVSNLISEPSVNAIVFNYRDITERRQAEEHIRYQSDLLQNVSDAIIGCDLNFHITSWNPAAEQIYGWRMQEVIGKPVNDFLQTEYENPKQEQVLGKFLEQGAWTGEAIQKRKDGTWLTVLSSVSQVRDSTGKVIGVVAINRDITERKQTEDRIQRQVRRLSGLRTIDMAISSTFDMKVSLSVLLHEAITQLGVDAAAVLLLDPITLRLEYAAGHGFSSPAIQQTRVRIGEGVAGRVALERHEIHIPDLAQAEVDFVRRGLLKEEAFHSYFATPLFAKGEVKGVLEIYHRSPLQTNLEWLDFLETLAGQAAIAIENAQLFENLHRSNLQLEQRVAERTAQLHRTNAELEYANRTKDEFLATMSHELRTPLNSILGLSETLLEQRRGSLNEHQQSSLQIIGASGHHLLDLINDILDLSKIEAGKFDFYPQPISVDEFCRASLAFVRAQALKKSIALTYLNEAPVSKILADPRRLKQIIVNLLTNAVKFTPEHGQVILHVMGDLEQDLIQFAVIDNGIGISQEDLKRLFQPFVQVDSSLTRQYQGTGLGLALVQKMTDLHGGSVHVESEVGKGSRFIVNLTCNQEEIAKLEPARSPGTVPSGEQVEKTETLPETSSPRGLILLADDNIPNILTIGEYLEDHGHEVIVAHDGLEAIQKAEQLNPNIILMDIQMPIMNGLDVIVRLRENPRFAATPIIALTALAMPGDRERSLLAGANEYMSKPVSLKMLLKTIGNLLGQGK